MTNFATLVGRVLMSVIFILGGFGKLMDPAGTIAYIGHGGLPLPEVGYAVAVFIELGLGLCVLLGLFTEASALVLAVWCIVTAAIFHSNFGDRTMQIQFLKNAAMAGGFIYVAAFGAGAFSLDALRARRRISQIA